jgi:hypothetical protein
VHNSAGPFCSILTVERRACPELAESRPPLRGNNLSGSKVALPCKFQMQMATALVWQRALCRAVILFLISVVGANQW